MCVVDGHIHVAKTARRSKHFAWCTTYVCNMHIHVRSQDDCCEYSDHCGLCCNNMAQARRTTHQALVNTPTSDSLESPLASSSKSSFDRHAKHIQNRPRLARNKNILGFESFNILIWSQNYKLMLRIKNILIGGDGLYICTLRRST